MSGTFYCTFCGKSQHEVTKLIAGPPMRGEFVGICNECVSLCAHIVVSEMEGKVLYVSKDPPLDSKEIIKEIVRELRQEAAQGTEAGTAETVGLGPKDDGPVGKADAPNPEVQP